MIGNLLIGITGGLVGALCNSLYARYVERSMYRSHLKKVLFELNRAQQTGVGKDKDSFYPYLYLAEFCRSPLFHHISEDLGGRILHLSCAFKIYEETAKEQNRVRFNKYVEQNFSPGSEDQAPYLSTIKSECEQIGALIRNDLQPWYHEYRIFRIFQELQKKCSGIQEADL